MKRTTKILALLIALATVFCCFVACGTEESDSKGTVKIVIGTEKEQVFDVDFTDIEITEGVLSVVKHLAASGKLTYKSNDSGYGAYLTEIGGLKEDSSTMTYIYIYTSVESDFDTSAYAKTMTWGGKSLTSAGVGISNMTVKDGAVIYIGTITYS